MSYKHSKSKKNLKPQNKMTQYSCVDFWLQFKATFKTLFL